MAYLAMARGNEKDAAARFDRALQADAGYVPALIGRGQVMLELDRDADALASFEAALAKDPSLTDLRSRVDVLKFRATQDMLARAKAAADARRWDEAAADLSAGDRGVAGSGFLYRDLAAVEQRAGHPPTRSSTIARRSRSIRAMRDRSPALPRFSRARAMWWARCPHYERARAIDPAEAPENAINRLRAAAALAKLPAEYRAIPTNPRSRGRRSPRWSASGSSRCWRGRSRGKSSSPTSAGTGRSRGSRRSSVGRDGHAGELRVRAGAAGAARRAGGDRVAPADLIASVKPELAKKWQAARVAIDDVASTHLSYPAVSAAVAAGVMTLRAATSSCCAGERRRGDGHHQPPRSARAPMTAQVFTIANQLTLLRMLLIPAFVILTLYGEFGWALAVFAFAGLTDPARRPGGASRRDRRASWAPGLIRPPTSCCS